MKIELKEYDTIEPGLFLQAMIEGYKVHVLVDGVKTGTYLLHPGNYEFARETDDGKIIVIDTDFGIRDLVIWINEVNARDNMKVYILDTRPKVYK